ncbi:hypothetical protein Sta7437_2546 [Stanieria cyanosphaera PCC 7437]|uniref:Uncharacterized protein n=1 Tax=Stanieria cyanosphaera (strain ATCC 29371 / PCC 7437) TaxID=111780 RepID=K9XVJ0_STAC7|nr:hypothetical protein [Stanieria cyanosphaera]AFZ36079.1 hypothetical protein Sta7437_2546 [Stanieria cyanosphaera PCC 7437]
MIHYQVIFDNIKPIPYQVPLVASFFIAWVIAIYLTYENRNHREIRQEEFSKLNDKFFSIVIVAMPLVFILLYGCSTFYNIFLLPDKIKNELVVEGKIKITSTELFDDYSSEKKWIKSFQIEEKKFVMFDIKSIKCFNNYNYMGNDYRYEEVNNVISNLSKKQRFVRASYHYYDSEKCISNFEIQR